MSLAFEIPLADVVWTIFVFPALLSPMVAASDFFLPRENRKHQLLLSGDGKKRYWVQAYLAMLTLSLPGQTLGYLGFLYARRNPSLDLSPILAGVIGGACGLLVSLLIIQGIRKSVSERLVTQR